MKSTIVIVNAILFSAALTAAGAPVSAQVSSASAAALGMGDNYTAAARGFNAVAWNPALLGLSRNPDFSFQVLTLRGISGVDPVTPGELADYQGELVPVDVKQRWLDRIVAEGNEQGTGGFDSNWFTLQADQFAFQVSTTGRAVGNITPGVARLLMFGNADETGEPQALDLSSSEMVVNAYSTAAFSFAVPVMHNSSGARLTVGVTGKYVMGHFVAVGESNGGTTADPVGVQFDFPIIHTTYSNADGGFDVQNGSGVGVDLGIGYEMGPWTIAGTVQNVINTFEWDRSRLVFVPGELVFDQDTSSSDFDSQPVENAPQALQDRVEDLRFKPLFAAGAAYRMSEKLLATADLRFGSSSGIATAATQHVGAGVEYRALPWLPLRLGGAYVQVGENNSGTQIAGGLGIDVLGFNLAASAARRDTDLGTDTVLMFTVLSRGM